MPAKRRIFSYFKQHGLAVVLVAIAVVLCVTNYTPGTWLTGWDTLHPEFDFVLNIKRLVFGVWRQEQGLGAVAIHSHMADLPRVLLLWLVSPVLPTSFLRYFYIFLCIIVGPLGVYAFIRQTVHKMGESGMHRFADVAAFLGGLLYLFNLGTLQQFNVPFEMFTTQFAALGWLFLFATRLLLNPSRKNAVWFFVINLLAAPQAYAATLFYAYALALFVYLGVFYLFYKRSLGVSFKRVIILIVITLAANSFWLLPNIYAIALHATEVRESKINVLFSDEAFLHNQQYGTPQDVSILKSFLFSWSAYQGKGTFDYLLKDWRGYTTLLPIEILFYSFFGVTVFGMIAAIRKRHAVGVGVMAIALVSWIFLMNANPPLGWIFAALRDHIPLFREALRTPFTKFSILLGFSYAVFFGIGCAAVCSVLAKKFQAVAIGYFVPLLIGFLIILSMLPAFAGSFINPLLRLKIPQDYFALNAYMKQQPLNGRVAELPMPSFWAWQYYDWGYQGAGMLWFGIPQPVLDRDFDRWSVYNEQYFREISYAVYAQNVALFEAVLQKYGIHYLVFDQHVTVTDRPDTNKTLYSKEIKQLLASSSKIHLNKTFSTKLAVYTFDNPNATLGLRLANNAIEVEPVMEQGNRDWAYSWGRDYVTTNKSVLEKVPLVQYFMRSLITSGDTINPNRVAIVGNTYSATLDQPVTQGNTQIPNYAALEATLPADVLVSKQNSNLAITFIFGVPWPKSNADRPTRTVLLPLGTEKNLILTVNTSQPLPIPATISETPITIGRVNLATKEANTIALFAADKHTTVPLLTQAATLFPERCSGPNANQLFGIDTQATQNELTFYSQNAIVCVTIPLTGAAASLPKTSTVLWQLDFDYQGKNAPVPYYCLFDTTRENCAYTSFGNPVPLVLSPDHFSDAVALDGATLGHSKLRLFLDAVSSHERKALTVRNMTLTLASPLAVDVITPSQIAQTLAQTSFPPLNKTAFEMVGFLPASNRSVIADVTKIKRNAESCTNILPTHFDRQLVDKPNERYITYSAENGTSCDHFDYPNLAHDQSYLVAIEARTRSGLPFRVCIANNANDRCDVATATTNTTEFAKNIIYLPANTSKGSGFSVDINNYSIGSVPSINDLKSITIIPFPGDWLSSLTLINQIKPVVVPSQVVKGTLPVAFLGTLDVKSANQANVTVALEQAYEPGWLLLKRQGIFLLPAGAKHVRINNWANGWVITNPTSEHYVVFFWPQLLEFLGFAFIISTAGIAWGWRHTKRPE